MKRNGRDYYVKNFASLRSTVTRSSGVPILNNVALERHVNLPTRKQKKTQVKRSSIGKETKDKRQDKSA